MVRHCSFGEANLHLDSVLVVAHGAAMHEHTHGRPSHAASILELALDQAPLVAMVEGFGKRWAQLHFAERNAIHHQSPETGHMANIEGSIHHRVQGQWNATENGALHAMSSRATGRQSSPSVVNEHLILTTATFQFE